MSNSLLAYQKIEEERRGDAVYGLFPGANTEILRQRLRELVARLDCKFGPSWERMAEALEAPDPKGIADFSVARKSLVEAIECEDHQLRLYALFGLLWADPSLAAAFEAGVRNPAAFREHWVPRCLGSHFATRLWGADRGVEAVLVQTKYPYPAMVVEISARYVATCMSKPEWGAGGTKALAAPPPQLRLTMGD